MLDSIFYLVCNSYTLFVIRYTEIDNNEFSGITNNV